MEQAVLDQLVSAALSVASGIAFGVFYDLLKALRLKLKSLLLTAFCDLTLCLTGFCWLFLLFMSIGGGEARLYIVLCFAIGAVVYFLSVGPLVLRFFTWILSLIAKLLHLLARPLRFFAGKLQIISKKAKMYFQNLYKRVTMKAKERAEKKAQAAKAAKTIDKEQGNEAQAIKHTNKNRNHRAGRLRGNNAVLPEAADAAGSGKAR